MIKNYLKGLLVSGVALLSAAQGTAQTVYKPMGIEINAGWREYLGDLGSSLFFARKPIYNGIGAQFGYYISPSFDAIVRTSAGDVGFYNTIQWENDPWKYAGFKASTFEFVGGARFKLNNGRILQEDAKLSANIIGGWGVFYVDSRINNINKHYIGFSGLVNGGLSVNYQVTDAVSLRVSSIFNYTHNDIWDGQARTPNHSIVHGRSKLFDAYMYHSFGIAYSFGTGGAPQPGKKMKDDDEDGVPNKYDKCPDTEEKYRNNVDSVGCPMDSDGDGLLDADDACPNLPGPAEYKGCPDSDGDGVEDKMDQCPTVMGSAAFNGCPDSDGDGVEDRKDDCPSMAGTAAFNGCPDSDGDGVEDRKDKCPLKAGPASSEGCPDSDGDGIFDNTDRCPDKAGIAANKGCPEIKQEVRQRIALAAKGINFETASDVILAESFDDLNRLTAILNEYKEAIVSIEGHTDNVGDPVRNKDLSQRRADAVKRYLTSQGVAAERLTATGFGQEKPIADNRTAPGRAKNRRVDFVLSY
jgi:outer membrane protein OmpA-like peptidoglycan-associated protein